MWVAGALCVDVAVGGGAGTCGGGGGGGWFGNLGSVDVSGGSTKILHFDSSQSTRPSRHIHWAHPFAPLVNLSKER